MGRNEVERSEVRKDAQLARELEFSIPREMPKDEGIRLAQDFVREQFVARGMVADLNVHWQVDPDGDTKPHAHVMLAMRAVGPDGFGLKARDWNRTGLLEDWRERWASLANERLAELGLDLRIDHRTFAEQGIALEPQNKIGPAGARREDRGEQAERAAEHEAIARRNGERIIAEPVCVLDAITRQQRTFTRQDVARFVDRHTADAAQFVEALAKVEASPVLVRVGVDGRGRERFSTREMLEVEQRLEAASYELAGRAAHGVGAWVQERVLENAERALGSEQQAAFEHVTGGADIAAVVGYAGTGKSTMLGVARSAWEASGYRVRGAALSGIAAEGLEAGAGIESRTLASLEHGWAKGRDALTDRDVLVVDEAGMVGSRQMERVLSAARNAGAKVVLVGDAEQLQAIEAGAAFRAVTERVGSVEITTVIRQQEAWQREATRELATGRTTAALARYEMAGMVQASSTREEARTALVAGWDAARQERGKASQMILAYTRDDVRALNELARARMRITGDLHGADQVVATERGERAFAVGDRILFQRNERGLGGDGHGRGGAAVKNGTLGTVLEVAAGGGRLTVRVDGSGKPSLGQEGKTGGREVTFYVRDYAHIDHGYAATVHKSQGVTVDRAHVLATPHMDRHAAYVGLTRHRDGVALHYAQEDFGEPTRLARALGRERAKDTTLDYDREDESVRRYAARRWLTPESEIVVRAPGGAKAGNKARQVQRAEAGRWPEFGRRTGGGARGAASRVHSGASIDGPGAPAREDGGVGGRLCPGLGRCRTDAASFPAGVASSGAGVAGSGSCVGGVRAWDGPGRADGAGGFAHTGPRDRNQRWPSGAHRGGGGGATGPAGAGSAGLAGGARLGSAGAGCRRIRLGRGAGSDAAPGDLRAGAEAGPAGGKRTAEPGGRVRGGKGLAAGACGAGTGGDRAADASGRIGAGART